mgnify:CR=1 FL=1
MWRVLSWHHVFTPSCHVPARRIWTYLTEIAAEGTSIIVTTHYIEEARQADTVGLMRNGKLLAEGPPGRVHLHLMIEWSDACASGGRSTG